MDLPHLKTKMNILQGWALKKFDYLNDPQRVGQKKLTKKKLLTI